MRSTRSVKTSPLRHLLVSSGSDSSHEGLTCGEGKRVGGPVPNRDVVCVCARARHHHDLTHARDGVEADGRELHGREHVVQQRVAHVEEPRTDVGGARGLAQRARGRFLWVGVPVGWSWLGLAGRGWSGLWGACAHPEPAVARVRAEKLALGVAVERIPAGDRRADHAIDLRLVDQRARVQQRRLGDADVRDKVAVGVLDQRAAKEQVPVGPARHAAHEAHGDLRARRVEAARVGVRRVHVGAHAHRAVARVHGVVARFVDEVEVVVLVARPPRARVRRARRLGARRLAHEPVKRLAAIARVRVKLGVVRAHEVASMDWVLCHAGTCGRVRACVFVFLCKCVWFDARRSKPPQRL